MIYFDFSLNWNVLEHILITVYLIYFDFIDHLNCRLPTAWLKLSLEVCFDHMTQTSNMQLKIQITKLSGFDLRWLHRPFDLQIAISLTKIVLPIEVFFHHITHSSKMQLKIQITSSVFDLLWLQPELNCLGAYFDYRLLNYPFIQTNRFDLLTKDLCSLISASFWPNPYDFEPACLPEKKDHTTKFLCLPKRLS